MFFFSFLSSYMIDCFLKLPTSIKLLVKFLLFFIFFNLDPTKQDQKNKLIIMSKKLHAFLLCCLFFISAQTFAQEREVTGKVLDGSGMPIPGVSVYVKGTTVGTTTDFDGEFSLAVSGENSVLVFSYIGFQP